VKALMPTAAIGADYWIVDSGATNHITGDRSAFLNYQTLKKGDSEHTISVADSQEIDVIGVGDITLAFKGQGKQYLLERVLHVAEFGTNSLLSVIRLTNDQQLKVEFGHNNVTVRADGTTVGVGTVINKLFYVKVASGIINSPHAAFVTKDHGDAILWHNCHTR
jgi:hypothetical protein